MQKAMEALAAESEKELISLIPAIHEKLVKMKGYCGIDVNTALWYVNELKGRVKEKKWLDALSALHTAFWEIDKQLTTGAAKEIKETE